jgi:hypothetical protein
MQRQALLKPSANVNLMAQNTAKSLTSASEEFGGEEFGVRGSAMAHTTHN